MTEARIKVSTQVALTILGWLVAALLAYGAVNARVAVLESRQQDGAQRMERIEQKLDRLLERVK